MEDLAKALSQILGDDSRGTSTGIRRFCGRFSTASVPM